MKKSKIKKLEKQILSQIDVPDGVLDKARSEIMSTQGEKSTISQSLPVPVYTQNQGDLVSDLGIVTKRRVLVPLFACLLVLAFAITITLVFVFQKNGFDGEPLYRIDELNKRSIQSISDYNQENSTEYICVKDIQTQSYVYNNDVHDILLSESFSFQDFDCIWYVWTDISDYRVDVLTDFDDCTETENIAVFDIRYNVGDDIVNAYFLSGEQGYYLKINNGNYSIMIDMFNLLLM